MVGLGEEIEPHFIVPQNSISNMPQKMGPGERQGANSTQLPVLIPLENSLRSTQPASVKCPHCENMAKNFLYLESLIRNNYNPKSQCGLCYSSLKYLQYVNQSIMKVFGSFEAIVQAAKSITGKQTRTPNPNARAIAAKPSVKTSGKKNPPKKRLNVNKLTRPVMQKTVRNANTVRLSGGGKLAKIRSRHEKRKNKHKSNKKANNILLKAGLEGKRKKAITTKINGVKQKNAKSKRNRTGTLRVIH